MFLKPYIISDSNLVNTHTSAVVYVRYFTTNKIITNHILKKYGICFHCI